MSDTVVISVFLFLTKHRNLSFEWLENAFGFSCLNYDEDCCEMGGSEGWDLVPLARAFNSMSWAEHWGDEATRQANSLGITECRRALTVLWDDAPPKRFKRMKPQDPVMIGPFTFADEADC